MTTRTRRVFSTNLQDRQIEAELALLHDPHEFVHVLWRALGGPLEMLLAAGYPRQAWANSDAAIALLYDAAQTPGADPHLPYELALEASATLATAVGALNLELGAIVEQLRHALLRYVATLEAPRGLPGHPELSRRFAADLEKAWATLEQLTAEGDADRGKELLAVPK